MAVARVGRACAHYGRVAQLHMYGGASFGVRVYCCALHALRMCTLNQAVVVQDKKEAHSLELQGVSLQDAGLPRNKEVSLATPMSLIYYSIVHVLHECLCWLANLW